jgi:hypothetical protein
MERVDQFHEQERKKVRTYHVGFPFMERVDQFHEQETGWNGCQQKQDRG